MAGKTGGIHMRGKVMQYGTWDEAKRFLVNEKGLTNDNAEALKDKWEEVKANPNPVKGGKRKAALLNPETYKGLDVKEIEGLVGSLNGLIEAKKSEELANTERIMAGLQKKIDEMKAERIAKNTEVVAEKSKGNDKGRGVKLAKALERVG